MGSVFTLGADTPNAPYVHLWEVAFKLMIIACEFYFKLNVLNFPQVSAGFENGYHLSITNLMIDQVSLTFSSTK